MKEILNTLFEYQHLGRNVAKDTLIRLARGEFNASQVAAFLTVFLMRNITLEELEGFREALMELRLPLNLNDFETIDLCGTGGDGKNTFNISTAASFVVAGAGQPVAKHGNYGVSSVSGSSNLLEYLGYRFTSDETALKHSLEEANICFLHAPLFHPAMKNVAPIRRELAVKTFFNMLGPMVNPVDPPYQMVGVFNLELARAYGYLYQNLGKKFSIVHALDGYDEISLTCAFKIIDNNGEHIEEPETFGFSTIEPKSIFGGDHVKDSAEIFLNVLQNQASKQQKDVVLVNAALALLTATKTDNFPEALALAKESLESGKAYQSFKRLVNLN